MIYYVPLQSLPLDTCDSDGRWHTREGRWPELPPRTLFPMVGTIVQEGNGDHQGARKRIVPHARRIFGDRINGPLNFKLVLSYLPLVWNGRGVLGVQIDFFADTWIRKCWKVARSSLRQTIWSELSLGYQLHDELQMELHLSVFLLWYLFCDFSFFKVKSWFVESTGERIVGS